VYIDMHSGLTISQADPRPMYLQIKEQIRHRVALGDWPAGKEVPSIRQLAVELRVSVITVKRAYLELEREGVIVTQHGKGSVVADNADLSMDLQARELEEHLAAALRVGRLLGLSDEDLAERLRQLDRQSVKKKA
jgi:GntR family transcriptional regulator